MTDRLDAFRNPRDGGAEPVLWVAVALSLLIHLAALLGLPQMRPPLLEQIEPSEARRSLSVDLVPLAPPPVAPLPARPAEPPPALLERPPAVPRARRAPPVTALKPPAPASPAPKRSFEGEDLSSYIDAKRRARAASAAEPAPGIPSAPRVEDEDTRRDRIAAANLASPRAPTFGYDPQRRGGAFQLQRVGLDDAEFIFYGWDKDARRNMARLIEVRKGANSDIRIAVVRKIIAIIREYEQGDFRWESLRMGRSVTLSARIRDNAGLEDFMMLEFFSVPVPGR